MSLHVNLYIYNVLRTQFISVTFFLNDSKHAISAKCFALFTTLPKLLAPPTWRVWICWPSPLSFAKNCQPPHQATCSKSFFPAQGRFRIHEMGRRHIPGGNFECLAKGGKEFWTRPERGGGKQFLTHRIGARKILELTYNFLRCLKTIYICL